jgi:hypothetical protein
VLDHSGCARPGLDDRRRDATVEPGDAGAEPWRRRAGRYHLAMRRVFALSSTVLLLGIGCASSHPIDRATDHSVVPTALPLADTEVDPHPDAGLPASAPPGAAPCLAAPLADRAVDGQTHGVVRGLLTDVETVQSGPVERLISLDLRDEDGVAWTFSVQGNPGITGAHAREHRDRRKPVTVTYGQAPRGLIAIRVDD